MRRARIEGCCGRNGGEFSGGLMKRNAGWIRVIGAVAVMMVCVALVSVAGNDAKTAGAHDYFRMKHVQVIDQGGFEKPVPAADLLIPADWKFESKVQWANRGCFTDLAAISFRAQSPDGRLVIEAFPSFSWQFSKDAAVQKYLLMENQAGGKVGLK